jgi:hypothetical protein
MIGNCKGPESPKQKIDKIQPEILFANIMPPGIYGVYFWFI